MSQQHSVRHDSTTGHRALHSNSGDAVSYPKIAMLIGGTWRGEHNGATVLNPADETVLTRLPQATRADLDDALTAAAEGFKIWRNTPPAQRAQIILGAARLLRERTEQVAVAMTLEQGKPIAQSRLEVLRAADIIEWDATEGLRTYGRIIPSGPGMRHTVVREPIGPVVAFSPWNFPVSAPSRKIAGALAAGCSIIVKPAEETPAGCFLLVKAFADAGVPAGVLNLVYGKAPAISEHLIANPIIRLLTFTGSVPVGKRLATLAGACMKPAIMELGGHCPVIICDDVDPIEAADASLTSKARNAGQVCVAPTRFFVQSAIYDRYVARFAERARALKQGDGMDPTNDLGPLANPRRVAAMTGLVSDAVAKGARLVAGGVKPEGRGYYYPMTVLADVPNEALAMHEEPFGPLALIQRVETVAEALSKANSLPFALAAYAFTHSADRVAQISDRIECGNLSINHFVASLAETPFGGVKDSGYGREGGSEGLTFYTTVKNISHKTRPL
jgi:succinate-semialdehyde dehydrogenase/glutarate-semialdehyde dehydrogenase